MYFCQLLSVLLSTLNLQWPASSLPPLTLLSQISNFGWKLLKLWYGNANDQQQKKNSNNSTPMLEFKACERAVKGNFLICSETNICRLFSSSHSGKETLQCVLKQQRVTTSKCLLVVYTLRLAVIAGWQIVLFWSQVSHNKQCQACYFIWQVLREHSFRLWSIFKYFKTIQFQLCT